MNNQSSHNSKHLAFNNQTFTSFYGRTVSEASSTVFSGKLEQEFINFIPEGGKILEVGGGSCLQAMKILKHRSDLEIVASDFSSEMISVGKKNYQELIQKDEQIRKVHSNLSFVQADAMDLSKFGSETFDGIYSLAAIKHFPDPIRGLNECTRILKPGGRMFFSEFYAESSFADMMNFAKYVKIPALLKPIVFRLLHIRIRNTGPSKVDLENWENELSSNGFAFSEYLQEYPFVILAFDKQIEKQKEQLSNKYLLS